MQENLFLKEKIKNLEEILNGIPTPKFQTQMSFKSTESHSSDWFSQSLKDTENTINNTFENLHRNVLEKTSETQIMQKKNLCDFALFKRLSGLNL